MWLIAFFILAILCAAKEESLKDPTFIYGQYINTGAYGSASVKKIYFFLIIYL